MESFTFLTCTSTFCLIATIAYAIPPNQPITYGTVGSRNPLTESLLYGKIYYDEVDHQDEVNHFGGRRSIQVVSRRLLDASNEATSGYIFALFADALAGANSTNNDMPQQGDDTLSRSSMPDAFSFADVNNGYVGLAGRAAIDAQASIEEDVTYTNIDSMIGVAGASHLRDVYALGWRQIDGPVWEIAGGVFEAFPDRFNGSGPNGFVLPSATGVAGIVKFHGDRALDPSGAGLEGLGGHVIDA